MEEPKTPLNEPSPLQEWPINPSEEDIDTITSIYEAVCALEDIGPSADKNQLILWKVFVNQGIPLDSFTLYQEKIQANLNSKK